MSPRDSTAGRFLIFAVLTLACVVAFASRLYSVIRFESNIHEFDPWFNYRATAFMVERGVYEFLDWFDSRAWYPLGRIVGGTVYPGLMFTSAAIHYTLHSLHIPVHIRDVCVFLAPAFSCLTAVATYLLTSQLWSSGAGLFAACFIAVAPGYISRSVAGSYDNEGIAIFALQLTFYLWLRSLNSGSVFYSCLTALSYLFMVSAWGGYVYIINLIPLHVFTLLLMGKFSYRLFTSYSTFYILGLMLSMQIPFVGFQPVHTSEHMAAAGVFLLLFIFAAFHSIRNFLTAVEFRRFIIFAIPASVLIVLSTALTLSYAGVIAPWSGRFYSLLDTKYAQIYLPIIASVSEHQPTPWFSFFMDLQLLVPTFPVGLWYCIQDMNDVRVFVVLYALSAVYMAGVMIRLMLTLTPVVCVLSGVAFSHLLHSILHDDDDDDDDSLAEPKPDDRYTPEVHTTRMVVVVVTVCLLTAFVFHCN